MLTFINFENFKEKKGCQEEKNTVLKKDEEKKHLIKTIP